MNLQQLDYLIAVSEERHFVKAANKCFVTQATLSMMIKRLEEELGVLIFNRTTKPVTVTKEGELVLNYAKEILAGVKNMKLALQEIKDEVMGDLRLGIIPTLAPYLLPIFLNELSTKFPLLKITIRELITTDIIEGLKSGDLDMGLLATPLFENNLSEHHLFYEQFYAYASRSENLKRKKYLLPEDINPDHLWLLEEGHCMRNQMLNFCQMRKKNDAHHQSIRYEAGSIETLINLVNKDNGVTILPKLATLNLSESQKTQLYEFAPPIPVREISLVTFKNYPRKKLLSELKDMICKKIDFTTSSFNTSKSLKKNITVLEHITKE